MSKKDGQKEDYFYKNMNFWLETSDENLYPRESLKNNLTVDIAILGGGFSGLWTAYYLIEKDPSLDIAIFEKDIVGFGASGRNGGWCSPKFSVTPEELIRRYGKNTASELQRNMFESIDEIERIIKKENLNIDWKKNGMLQVALGNYNKSILANSYETYKKLGFEGYLELLDVNETKNRVNINNASGGLFTKKSAVVHPGKFVRQLAKTVERKGVRIYEQTEISDFSKGNVKKKSQFITTSNKIIQAKKAILLSGEAYLSQLKKFKRKIIPTYSLITLTEPLSDDQWNQIGWKNRESVSSTALSVHYLQRTADNRILFGGRGAPYHFASKIKNSFDYHKPTHEMLKQTAMKWFPSIHKNSFSHSWGGPVGMTRDWMPNFVFDKENKIGGAWGYVGQGVSTTNLAGRILSDLILENNTDVTRLPMVQHNSKKWEPEPFRWLGARYVQSGMERVDYKSDMKRRPPTGKSIPEKLSRH